MAYTVLDTLPIPDLLGTTCGCGSKHQRYEWSGSVVSWRGKTWLLRCAFDQAASELDAIDAEKAKEAPIYPPGPWGVYRNQNP